MRLVYRLKNRRPTVAKQMTPAEMDAAAEKAAGELEKLNRKAVEELAAFWQKWYLHTGHKRLGRLLLGFAPEKVKTQKGD